MAKSKKKKTTSKGSTTKKTKARGESEETCPSCDQAKPLFWHGRRVLCEACIEDNTHEAERGEVTPGALMKGGIALFRDVGWPVVGLVLGYSIASKAALHLLPIEDDATQMAASFAREIVGLVFIAAAFDFGLARLDGETPSIGRSLALGVRKAPPLLLAQALQGMIVMLHLVFLVVPGVVKALSYAVVTPLVVSGEAGAISCLHESWKRMQGHRKRVAPLMLVLWLPFIAYQWVGAVMLTDPSALTESVELIALDAFFPLLDLPWLFVALSLHAKLRARHRLAAE